MSKRQHGYIPEFDGMRALSIVLVMLFHVWRYAGDNALGRGVSAVASTGWSGVDVFFVLSGFLITGILLNTRERPDYWRSFYIRRGIRIFPLYYAVMTAILIGAWVLRSQGIPMPDPALEATDRMWINFLYLTNFAKAFYGADFVPLDIAWSLAIEEQFYLVFPFIVRFASRTTLKRCLWGAVLLAPLFRIHAFYQFGGFTGPYVLPQCRMDALAIGGLVLLLMRDASDASIARVGRSAWVLVPAAVAFLLLARRSDLSFVFAGYSVVALAVGAVIVWVLEHPGSKAAAVFRLPALTYVGRVSYGLYLFHLIARGGVDVLLGPLTAVMAESVPLAFARLLLITLVAVGMATVSFYGFERPLLKWKNRLAPQRPNPILAAPND